MTTVIHIFLLFDFYDALYKHPRAVGNQTAKTRGRFKQD